MKNATILMAALLISGLLGCTSDKDTNPKSPISAEADNAIDYAVSAADWQNYKRSSDSLLEITEKKVDSLRTVLYEHRNRRNIAKRRRDFIKVEYQLDELKARLEKRHKDYMASIRRINDLIRENPSFKKDLSCEIVELDAAVARMTNDSLK